MTKARDAGGTTFDDPNRESLGLPPIWTGASEAPPDPDPEPEPQVVDAEPEPYSKSKRAASS